jgi:2-C-methyl-D-erythritol 4-phosphate cytidylyltransferase/2-C-methyl-D-erythritol 2,4-cyclodiphosphate synthase
MSIDPKPTVMALVVAAGRGLRAGGGRPKQYRELLGRPVLTRTLAALLDTDTHLRAVCVINPDDRGLYDDAVARLDTAFRARVEPPIPGASTRAGSVRNGLEGLAVRSFPDVVLVHDAARPFVSSGLIHRAVGAALASDAAVPGTLVTDTLKTVDDDGLIRGTPDRDALRAVQTPQAFRFKLLLEAHRRAAEAGRDDFTDDGAVVEWAGHPVRIFEGDAGNMKLTTPGDFETADRRLRSAEETRCGLGYDVHAFGPGDHVMLGGIRIPHDQGVQAHSDGDVVLHALTDAVLGALADGDIGSHFPPSDPQWKGASSDRFLAHAVARLAAGGGRIVNCDVTVVCEAPRIGPHRDAMRERIAAICGIGIDRVAVKATTSERMGFTGRREGLAAQALVTVSLPAETD